MNVLLLLPLVPETHRRVISGALLHSSDKEQPVILDRLVARHLCLHAAVVSLGLVLGRMAITDGNHSGDDKRTVALFVAEPDENAHQDFSS